MPRPSELRLHGALVALIAEIDQADGGTGIGVVPAPGLERDHLRWVAGELRALVRSEAVAVPPAGAPDGAVAATGPEVATSSMVLRHDLRLLGFDGPLRAPLRLTGDAGEPGAPPVALDLAAAIEHLVPGTAVEPRAANPLRGLARRAVGRVGAMDDLDVELPGGARFALSVPRRDDLAVEAVAVVVDTLRRAGGRFPRLKGAVRAVSLDRFRQDADDTTWMGLAHGTIGVVHLRADLFLADRPAPFVLATELPPGRWPPEQLPVPYAAHEVVTAHECWHQLEHDFETRRYRDSIEFRRRLGEWFGVDTLEHAVRGRHRGAPAAWQEAYRRLVAEVSAYAGTSPKEATAELFEQWWRWPEPKPPVLVRFGELLDEFVEQVR